MADYIEIKLEPHEVALAFFNAFHDIRESRRQGLKHRGGVARRAASIWDYNIDGRGGEIAAARVLNCYYSNPTNSFSDADVGGVEVKTRREHHYDLRVRDTDPDTTIFLLVTGKAWEGYRVHGWIYGHDAKQPEWWNNPDGSDEFGFFVPKSQLRPIAELPPEATRSIQRRKTNGNGQAAL
jgi:hypothetical protein